MDIIYRHMGVAGILIAAAGACAVFIGGVIGIPVEVQVLDTIHVTEFVTNLPTLIIGSVGVIGGLILLTPGAVVASGAVANDKSKWHALLKYDDEVALVVNKLKPLGQKWVDEFVCSYIALDDRKYLPLLVRKIIAAARAEHERNNQGSSS